MPDADASPNSASSWPDSYLERTSLTLLERARAKDPHAWERLVSLYQPLVLNWCTRGGLNHNDAEDAAQEVFTSVARALADFRRDRPGDTFRGWLRVVAINQIRLHYRRKQGRPRGEGGWDNLEALQQVPDPLVNLQVDDAYEVSLLYQRAFEQVRCNFEERTWQAFWLTTIEGRTPAALVNELGMTTAAIRQAKCRVLQHLRRELGDIRTEPDQS